MLVVSCIKQVPDTTQVKIDPITNTLIRDGIPFIMNPYDTHALEESLRLRDEYGVRSVALSMGPPNAEATLRKACAVGVDEAILVSDRCFGGADTLATSCALSAAIERLSKEEDLAIVFCGKQTIDGDTAQVGPGVCLASWPASVDAGRPHRASRSRPEIDPGSTQAGRSLRNRRSATAGHDHRGARDQSAALSHRADASGGRRG